ncbi:PAS domain-containing protein [Chitinibacter sp. SCUT-21]|uniref:PAS domain-containing protein n=1 Tax=Chitinibacter sp. SCUT-21 TaxID=2970891 RepID=UPI0035A64010
MAAIALGKVVLKPKEEKTYTDSQTTIVPPANPVDVLAGIPDLLWTIDYASRRVSSHNDAHIEHHPDGCQFAKLANIFPARVSRQYLETLIELQNTQLPIRFEYTLGNHGEQYTFEARLSPLSERDCVVVIRDISHIKATEEALFKQQIFTQQIIDSSPNLVFIRDQYGRFLLVNQTTQTLLGHDLLVHSHMGLDDDTPILGKGDAEVFATGKTLRIEDSCVLPSGRTHWFDITKVAVEREGKTYLLSIAIDITTQKEQEAARDDCKALVHAMAHALPHAFMLVQYDQILFANHAACTRLGLSPELLIGESLKTISSEPIASANGDEIKLSSSQGEEIRCSVRQLEPSLAASQLITLH